MNRIIYEVKKELKKLENVLDTIKMFRQQEPEGWKEEAVNAKKAMEEKKNFFFQEEASEFAKILVSEGAEQCGFCSPGFIMTVLAMKKELENPTEEEIKHYLTGNLCRCTGYMGQLRAIKTYMGVK